MNIDLISLVSLDQMNGLKEHNHRVGILAHKLALKCQLDNILCNDIRIAGKLHDIGKYYIPKNIINKPGQLTKTEYEVIKQHSFYSSLILKEHSFGDPIVKMVYYHHESWDGTGYPRGLKGDDIPIGARIIKICDTYDALTNDRVYRDKYKSHEALKIMESENIKYDKMIFDIFKNMINKKGVELI